MSLRGRFRFNKIIREAAPIFRCVLFLFIVFNIVSLRLPAQTVSQLVRAGDAKVDEGNNYEASLYYKQALERDKDDAEILFKYAEACRMFNDYKHAAEAYARAVSYDRENHYTLAMFWLGEMLKCTGHYEEAARQFQRFKGRYRKKDYYYAKAQQEIESCTWAFDHWKNTDSAIIIHLGRDVNTEASEFNAIPVYPDKLQFSSLRNISTDKKKPNYLVRIYNQTPNPEPIFLPEGANPDLSVGNGAYSPDSKRFFFTECEPKDKTSQRCDIYVTRYENYKWAPAEKLGEQVNDPQATNTHPAVGYDKSGNEVLFFVSDRPGGQGNLDIWISRLDSAGNYFPAINAGPVINTPGNEVTPFYDVSSKTLYFSSDWHYGFGGYDIFSTKGEYTDWTAATNLLRPINSPQNDLYYSVTPDHSRAYITSNREGSYFIEAETCCNDIYEYTAPVKKEKIPDTTAVVRTSALTVSPVDTVSIVQGSATEKLKRIVEKLPVRLYFHNDEPECCNLRDTTSIDYLTSYEAYIARAGEYKKEYSDGLKGNKKVQAEKEIDSLFGIVERGYNSLNAFTGQLLELLQSGSKMKVTIQGYCSPLNYSNYNIQLGYRRVASLKNYFYHYQNGVLLPYLANGSLVLKTRSFGKETAPATVSDKLSDTRNSVYSPAAAMERRVEIIALTAN